MTPHTQTIFAADDDWREKGIVPGNCFQTAVASLLDLPLDAVPHFVADTRPGPGWWEAARTWAREERGSDFTWADAGTDIAEQARTEIAERNLWGGLMLASGRTVRDTHHVVVVHAADLSLAHDPHPSGAGLIEPAELWWFCGLYEPDPQTQYADALAGSMS